MTIQPITFACGHRSSFRTSGNQTEAFVCADVLSRYPCSDCDRSRQPILWIGRPAVDYLMEEARRMGNRRRLPKCLADDDRAEKNEAY